MNIIIPMAGWGKRLRPHTLTVPKPLVPVAGKPIVHHLVENLAKAAGDDLGEVAFIIREEFGKDIEEKLLDVAKSLGANGRIFYQDEPLGTAHAILCAKEALTGPVIVAFADTLFTADFTLDTESDGTIWVKQVEDPSAFGVVQLNEENVISDFVEKPSTFVSDLAIIGIYFFKDGDNLRNELQYLLDNNITDKGEFQLTSALENMKQKGAQFIPGKVDEWLDCGNKDATVYTNQRMLALYYADNHISSSASMEQTTIIPPCYIGENVKIVNSVVGPHVSIGNGTIIEQSIVSNSIIQSQTKISGKNLVDSMIGNEVSLSEQPESLSIGDYVATE